MASTEVEYSGTRKRTGVRGKLDDTAEFFYNKNDGSIMGRTCASWAKLIIFYTIYYIFLSAFFAFCLYMCFLQIESDKPLWYGMDTPLKGNPGMGFRPQPDVDQTLIRFTQGEAASYKVYTDHLQAFIDQYENDKQVSENLEGCTEGQKPDDNKVCRFEINDLGNRCSWNEDFGYDEGQPCVLLKLNKVYGWEPQPFPGGGNATQGDKDKSRDVPESARKALTGTNVVVTCEGENPADKENIGEVDFFPSKHFSTQFFPYLNQEGYRAPIVMAQFKNATNGVLIQVWCKAWAENIYHHRNDKAGSVHFEILID